MIFHETMQPLEFFPITMETPIGCGGYDIQPAIFGNAWDDAEPPSWILKHNTKKQTRRLSLVTFKITSTPSQACCPLKISTCFFPRFFGVSEIEANLKLGPRSMKSLWHFKKRSCRFSTTLRPGGEHTESRCQFQLSPKWMTGPFI